MLRGDVYRFKLPKGVGHEQHGDRYGVVVQADEFLPRSVVLVAPTSRSARPASFRPEIDVSYVDDLVVAVGAAADVVAVLDPAGVPANVETVAANAVMVGLDGDVGCGVINLAEVVVGEVDGGGGEVLLRPGPLGRAGDGGDPWLLGQEHARTERDLGPC